MNFQNEQLKYQIEEQSPFSEEFVITWEAEDASKPVLVALDGQELSVLENCELRVRGIFDESVERESANSAIRKKPRLYVYRWLRPMPAETRVVVRSKEYVATSYDIDANMGIVVWLR
jgi:hypothetical protein